MNFIVPLSVCDLSLDDWEGDSKEKVMEMVEGQIPPRGPVVDVVYCFAGDPDRPWRINCSHKLQGSMRV